MRALGQAFTRVGLLRSHTTRVQACKAVSAHHLSPKQLLQFQSYFPYQFAPNQTAAISTSSPVLSATSAMASTPGPLDADASYILEFWFGGDEPEKKWFMKSDDFDDQVRKKFGALVEKARETAELDHWTETPEGTVALIILLDQFPRNIYRHSSDPATSHLSFASDKKAQGIVLHALTLKSPSLPATATPSSVLPVFYQQFLYMPFMHAEDLKLQLLGKILNENLALRSGIPGLDLNLGGHGVEKVRNHVAMSVPFAQKHVDCVKELGRFPKRNEALRRETTEQERVYLEEHPEGF